MERKALERLEPGLPARWYYDPAHYAGELEVFWDSFWSTFEDVQLETHNLTDAGSEVVFANTAHVRGRDGIEVSARSTQVFTVENGQITRLRMFQERAEALEAVGLRE